jgi:agmatinase
MAKQTQTFLGFPAADLSRELGADIAILGAPHGTPYEPGAANDCAASPGAIRQASARPAHFLEHYDFDLGGPLLAESALRIVDCGDIPGDPSNGAANREAIGAATRAVLDAGAAPILLGGDDSVPIPFLASFEGSGPIWILQIDAHLDWRDEVGGEPMGWSSVMRRASEMDHVEGMVQVGLRGPGSARAQEVADAKAWGSKLVGGAELHGRGVEPVIALLPEGANIVITLDCDGLDPAVMPGMIYPAPGGLSYAQAIALIQGAARRGRLIGFDLTELRPDSDSSGLAVLTA